MELPIKNDPKVISSRPNSKATSFLMPPGGNNQCYCFWFIRGITYDVEAAKSRARNAALSQTA